MAATQTLDGRSERADRRWLLLAALAAGVAIVASSAPAQAHRVGLSRGSYQLVRTARSDATAPLELRAAVVLAGAELRRATGASRGARFAHAVAGAVVAHVDGQRCALASATLRRVENDGLQIDARYRCAAAARPAAGSAAAGSAAAGSAVPYPVSLRFDLLDTLGSGHRHIATLRGAGSARVTHVAYGKDRTLRATLRAATLGADDATAGAGAAGAKVPAASPRAPGAFFWLGVEHILLGFDHLVFLLALIIIGGRARDLAGYVTAFTVAHSVTLAVSVLGLWRPSPALVEPAIALTIAYVGVENFFIGTEHAAKRWRLAFLFGLIHGFGFAGALAEIGLPSGAGAAAALALFNLGVEAGQLAVLCVLVPLVLLARRSAVVALRGQQLASASVAALGLFWFVSRVL